MLNAQGLDQADIVGLVTVLGEDAIKNKIWKTEIKNNDKYLVEDLLKLKVFHLQYFDLIFSQEADPDKVEISKIKNQIK